MACDNDPAKRYLFREPPLLTPDEYAVFKRALSTGQKSGPPPGRTFWKEFPGTGWLLIAISLCTAAGILWPPVLTCSGLFTIVLIFDLAGGRFQSVIRFLRYRTAHRRYFRKMRGIVLCSSDYRDYLRQIVRI